MNRGQDIPIRVRLFHKLNPSRFFRMSRLMAAIVGHLLDVSLVTPPIAEVNVTNDGCVLVTTDGRATYFVGNYADLIRNWTNLVSVAGLTTTERYEVEALFASKVGYLGRTSA